jgi:hypothetical protein
MFMIDMHGTRAWRDRREQLAHARRAVLRLLHREHDEVVAVGAKVGRDRRRQLARQVARVDLDELVASLERDPDPRAVRVERLDLGGQAGERDRVPGRDQLDGEQRPVGRAQAEHLPRNRHSIPPRSPVRGFCGSGFSPTPFRD